MRSFNCKVRICLSQRPFRQHSHSRPLAGLHGFVIWECPCLLKHLLSKALVDCKFNFGAIILIFDCLLRYKIRRARLKQGIELLLIQRHWAPQIQTGVGFKILIANLGSPSAIASNSEATPISFVVVN
jgi:hypothetical protein